MAARERLDWLEPFLLLHDPVACAFKVPLTSEWSQKILYMEAFFSVVVASLCSILF